MEAEETFDVVDEADQVLSRATRSAVHRQGLRHRAVHVLVYDAEGRVFLQKRSMSKETYPGAWDTSAAGHVVAGEDYDACARRELGEELSIHRPRGLQRLFKLEPTEFTGHEFVWVYRCQAEEPIHPEPSEIDEGGWYSPEEINSWVAATPGSFSGVFRLIWSRLM